MITQKGYGRKIHDVVTLQENEYEYNAKSIFNFSMNDMVIKTVQFSISTLQFKSKMQYFAKCTKLMIKIHRQKCQPMQNAYFFLYFQYIKGKMNGLKRNLIYKFYYV